MPGPIKAAVNIARKLKEPTNIPDFKQTLFSKGGRLAQNPEAPFGNVGPGNTVDIIDVKGVTDVEGAFNELQAMRRFTHKVVGEPPHTSLNSVGKSLHSAAQVGGRIDTKALDMASDDLFTKLWDTKAEVGQAAEAAAVLKFTSGPQSQLTKFLMESAAGEKEFTHINRGQIPGMDGTLTPEEVSSMRGWDMAINKASTPLEESTPIVRSITLGGEDDDIIIQKLTGEFGTVKEGDDIVFPAHSSFSFDQRTGENFAMGIGRRVVFEIHNPKGLRGIDTTSHIENSLGVDLTESATSSREVSAMNNFMNEREFILQRHQPLKVLKVIDKTDGDSGILRVFLEPVENTDTKMVTETSRYSSGRSYKRNPSFDIRLKGKEGEEDLVISREVTGRNEDNATALDALKDLHEDITSERSTTLTRLKKKDISPEDALKQIEDEIVKQGGTIPKSAGKKEASDPKGKPMLKAINDAKKTGYMDAKTFNNITATMTVKEKEEAYMMLSEMGITHID